MTDRELMQQALEALDWAADCIEPRKPHNCDCPICVASDALRERLAQPERIQLTVRDFVVTVGDIEDAVGTPMYWAEWPNKENA